MGDVLRLAVERVAHGGHCVARYEGRVVFVRHTLPGERVDARVTEVRSGFLRADTVEVLTPAAGRVTPPCPYAGDCGGCDWQHAAPATQRELKAVTVAELLTRLGRLDPAEVDALGVTVEELPGGPLDWRTRVRYAVARDGRPGLRAHRSHRVVAVDACPIATPAVRELPVTDRRWHPRTELSVVSSSAGDPAVLEHRSVRGRTVTRRAYGVGEVVERAVGREFRVPAEAFWQVHPAAPDTLADAALDLLAPRPGERCWDLYGGVGLFSAALAAAVGPDGAVTLVESGRSAVAAAAHNLGDLPAVRTVAGRVERVLPTLGDVDVVLLDPPRSGAGREVVTALAGAAPRAICYVACDPAALARDAGTFAGLGWRLTTLRAFDAFPMTQHVECVALFTPAD
ncbi:class I SAM-dependent RNA methyltransferase [Actinocatenispora rupis]|uniref:23S rRNA methyltransferase n=1 Tax=Actinocatenispora rupis TaxID=519421 RepID=A0A8J3NDE8_9ACTN|nr:TRAM domain-containing protein [Actinocatenispora rupis]GID12832.1 23S rRNA methyltransferase [Actinocatenispora rupis]